MGNHSRIGSRKGPISHRLNPNNSRLDEEFSGELMTNGPYSCFLLIDSLHFRGFGNELNMSLDWKITQANIITQLLRISRFQTVQILNAPWIMQRQSNFFCEAFPWCVGRHGSHSVRENYHPALPNLKESKVIRYTQAEFKVNRQAGNRARYPFNSVARAQNTILTQNQC